MLPGQEASPFSGVSVPGTPWTENQATDNPDCPQHLSGVGGHGGRDGRGAQPWLGVEEQPAWASSGAGVLLQLGRGFPLLWAAGLFLVTSSCGILLPWLLSASWPCSLHPLLSGFIFISIWSWPNYPPPLGLRGLLSLCCVHSPCASLPFSLQFSNHICNRCKCNLTLVFIWRDQPSVDDNSSRLSLASELHLLKWEVGCVGWGFFKSGYI